MRGGGAHTCCYCSVITRLCDGLTDMSAGITTCAYKHTECKRRGRCMDCKRCNEHCECGDCSWCGEPFTETSDPQWRACDDCYTEDQKKMCAATACEDRFTSGEEGDDGEPADPEEHLCPSCYMKECLALGEKAFALKRKKKATEESKKKARSAAV